MTVVILVNIGGGLSEMMVTVERQRASVCVCVSREERMCVWNERESVCVEQERERVCVWNKRERVCVCNERERRNIGCVCVESEREERECV